MQQLNQPVGSCRCSINIQFEMIAIQPGKRSTPVKSDYPQKRCLPLHLQRQGEQD